MNLTRPLCKHDTNYVFTCVESFMYLYKSVQPSLKERLGPFNLPSGAITGPKNTLTRLCARPSLRVVCCCGPHRDLW